MTHPLCPRCGVLPPDPAAGDAGDADAAAHGVTACHACGYVLDDAPLAAGGAAVREEAGEAGRVYVGEDGDGAGTGKGIGGGGRVSRSRPPLRPPSSPPSLRGTRLHTALSTQRGQS